MVFMAGHELIFKQILPEWFVSPILLSMQRGRISEAEMQLEKLLGPLHVKSAMAELSRSEKDDGENVKYSELFRGRYFSGTIFSTIHPVALMHLI
jgi:hypothetical protein